MSKADSYAESVKDAVRSLWSRILGGQSSVKAPSADETREAYEECSAEVRSAFSREPEKVQSSDTVEKVKRETGLRSLAASELHKAYQMSRRGKLENAANLLVFATRPNGGLDIMRGRADNV